MAVVFSESWKPSYPDFEATQPTNSKLFTVAGKDRVLDVAVTEAEKDEEAPDAAVGEEDVTTWVSNAAEAGEELN
jgi:hypothetical protein